MPTTAKQPMTIPAIAPPESLLDPPEEEAAADEEIVGVSDGAPEVVSNELLYKSIKSLAVVDKA